MTKYLGLATLGLLLFGCSDVGLSEEGIESTTRALINCGTNQLGRAPLENSCGLGWVGPFGNDDGTGSDANPIAASADVNFPGATPALGSVQVLYTVDLPGNPGANQGAVKFVPPLNQDYSIVTDESVSVSVRDGAGTVLTPLFTQNIAAACDDVGDSLPSELLGVGMTSLAVYRLAAGTTYTLVFPASPFGELHVAIDEPNDFLNMYYPDLDGDGFGDHLGGPFISECVPPAGRVDNADDCDDTNASVSPEAAEIVGAGDNNCDGVPDGDVVTADLVLLDVTVLDPPAELALGRTSPVLVRYRYVNRGPARMDATLSTSSIGAGVSIQPGGTIVQSVPNLTPVRTEELTRRYRVKCRERRHHGHHRRPRDGDQMRTLTFTGDIQPADAADVDTNPGNNSATASFEFECVDCRRFRHHRSHRHGVHGGRGEPIPEVCKVGRPRRHHCPHGHDHGHPHHRY